MANNEQYLAMQIQVELRDAIASLSRLSDEMKGLAYTVNDSEKTNKQFEKSFENATNVLEKTGKTIVRVKSNVEDFTGKTKESGKASDETKKDFKEMGEEANKAGKKGKKGIEELSNEAGRAKQNTSFFKDMFKANLAITAVKTVSKAVWDFGKHAIESTAGFQKSMNEVYTLMPGASKESMKKMEDDILNLSDKFGILPNEAVPALYQSLSAGVPQDNVMDFLEVAQKGATAGVSDVTTAVDGLSSIVNAWGSDTISAAQASDLMFTAVKQGKTTFGEISSSISQVGPLAASMGVQFSDVSAAISSMTSKGTPTAQAMTQMKAAFSELGKESSNVSKEFKKMSGQSFKDFIAGGGDLQGALKILEEGSKKSGKGINELFGSVEAGQFALSLTGKGTEKFAEDLEQMKNSAGATDTAFNTMDKGLDVVWRKLTSKFTVRLVKLGTMMAPIVEKVGEALLLIFPFIDKLAESFNNPAFPQFAVFLEELGSIFMTHLAPSIGQLITTLTGIFMGFIQLIVSNGESIKTIFEGASNIVNVLVAIISSGMRILSVAFGNIINVIVKFVSGFMKGAGLTGESGKELSDTISTAFNTMADIITAVWSFVSPIFNFIAEALGFLIGNAVKGLLDLFGLLGNAINKVGGFFKKIFNKEDAKESKEALDDVNNSLKKVEEQAQKGAKAEVEINKKETIETTVDYKAGAMPTPANSTQELKIDTKNLSTDIEKIGTSIQNNPQDTTRNNILEENKQEISSLKSELITMKNAIIQKLEEVVNAIKNRNVIVNVHGLTADEVVNKITASLQKG